NNKKNDIPTTNIDDIPEKSTTIPEKSRNIPKKSRNIPEKSSSISDKVSTIPENSANIPTNDNSIIPKGQSLKTKEANKLNNGNNVEHIKAHNSAVSSNAKVAVGAKKPNGILKQAPEKRPDANGSGHNSTIDAARLKQLVQEKGLKHSVS
ncbi:unnamed protein product, partial [Owenia fusiformis]